MTDNQIKVGSYVTDASDSGRFYKNVWQVTGFSFDRAITRYVGHIKPDNKLDTSRPTFVSHRLTANLRLWD